MRDVHTSLDAFLSELQLIACTITNESSNVLDTRDVQEAVRLAPT